MKRIRFRTGHLAVAVALGCGGTETEGLEFGQCGETVSVEDVCRAQVAALQLQAQLGAPCNLSESRVTMESCLADLAENNCSEGALCYFRQQFEVFGNCLEDVAACSNDTPALFLGRVVGCVQAGRTVPIPIDEIGTGCTPPS